jgi:hypothetical protein
MAVGWVVVILAVPTRCLGGGEMSTVKPTDADSHEGADRADTAQRDKQLVDEAIEAYVAWREACIWLNDAYLAWSRQRGSNAHVTFGGFTAALDHQDRTAACYARVSDVLGRDEAYLEPRPGGVMEASQ